MLSLYSFSSFILSLSALFVHAFYIVSDYVETYFTAAQAQFLPPYSQLLLQQLVCAVCDALYLHNLRQFQMDSKRASFRTDVRQCGEWRRRPSKPNNALLVCIHQMKKY